MHKLVTILFLMFVCSRSIFAISAQNFINNSDCDQIIDKTFLTICYDYNYKAAKAVSYTLQGDLVNELNINKRPRFKVEKDISTEYRASYSDYTRSGWDRGHLAPDATFDWSQESLDAAYSLANIIPQAHKVNGTTWVKAERYARFVAVQLGQVNVVNVVKYPNSPKRIGKHGIAVPSGYYKVLYSSDQSYTRCLYYANDRTIDTSNDKLKNHEVDCDTFLPIKEDYSFLIPVLMMINN